MKKTNEKTEALKLELKEIELKCLEAKKQYDICKAKVEETQSHSAYSALKTALDNWEQTTIDLERIQSELFKRQNNGSK